MSGVSGQRSSSDPAEPPEALFPTKGSIPEALQIGRGEAVEDLVGRVVDGDDVVTIEPRRVGKSSTIGNAALVRAHEEYGAVVAEVDLRQSGVRDASSLADALVKSALSTGAGTPIKKTQAGRLSGRTRRFLLGERSRAAADLLGEQGRLKTAQTLLTIVTADASPAEQLDRVFAALEAEAAGEQRPVIVFIDEVQDLGSERWSADGQLIQQALERAMRRPGRLVSFVFAGSDQAAMESVFAPGQPLHREGERYRLPPISAEAWRDGLVARFASDGRSIDVAGVDRILGATGGHPLRTMQVCKHALRQARRAGMERIDDALIDESVSAAREHPSWGKP